MEDTPFTTSENDGLSYAKAGGARRARVPISVGDLKGILRKMIRLEVDSGGAIGINVCPEISMANTCPDHDLITGGLYFSNTTSLKA